MNLLRKGIRIRVQVNNVFVLAVCKCLLHECLVFLLLFLEMFI